MSDLEIDKTCFNCLFNHSIDPESGEKCNEGRCNNRKCMFYGTDNQDIMICGQWRKDPKSFGSEDK